MSCNVPNIDSATREKINVYVGRFNKVKPLEHAHNLYSTDSSNGVIRAHNLIEYLLAMASVRPKILLIGEAPGYKGTLRTGVPFASEHAVSTDQAILSNIANYSLPKHLDSFKKEPTSTIVCRTLRGLKRTPLLWAIFPHHPHKPGNPQSNRAPTKTEIHEALPFFQGLLDIFSDIEQIVAVGNVAKHTLEYLGIDALKIRHPSHGGAMQFATQIQKIMTQTD